MAVVSSKREPRCSFYDDPDNQFVAGFVGSPRMNFLPAHIASVGPSEVRVTDVAGTGDGVLPLAGLSKQVGPVTIGLRPENVRILPGGENSSGLVVEGVVKLVEELGSESFVHVELKDGTRIIVRAGRRAAEAQGIVRVEGLVNSALLFNIDGQRVRGAGTSL